MNDAFLTNNQKNSVMPLLRAKSNEGELLWQSQMQGASLSHQNSYVRETDYLQTRFGVVGEGGETLTNTFLPVFTDLSGRCTFCLESVLNLKLNRTLILTLVLKNLVLEVKWLGAASLMPFVVQGKLFGLLI